MRHRANNNIVASCIARIIIRHAQGALTHSTYIKKIIPLRYNVELRFNRENYSFYIALCNSMVYKVPWRNILPIKPGTPGQILCSILCTGLFYVRYTTHGTNGFTSHPKDKQWLSVQLAKKCLDWGSNPHSAEQKHQSLNSVLLTARPRHFHQFVTIMIIILQGVSLCVYTDPLKGLWSKIEKRKNNNYFVHSK